MNRQQASKKTRTSSPSAVSDAAQPTLRVRALRLLARREFSRQELQKRLRSYVAAGDSGQIDALLDDLAERGWVSDKRYADALVRKRKDQYARRSIVRELKQAGVDDDVTTAAVGDIDPDEEFTAALSLLHRKFRRTPADQKEKARQIRFLQSRGYGLGLVLRAIKQGAAEGEASDSSRE
jgi:regulatory protein